MKQDVLHLKSPVNWINDPNGFIYYKGKYHLFYQHFPYAPIWGTMHWGHAVSEDLVHWEHKKIALFPTKSYDRNGVFSGSAIEKDEKLYFYYSAVRYLEQDEENIHLSKNDQIETSQAMLISEDGEKFDNWNGKKQIIPVIRDEEIADAMQKLGLTVADLIQPNQLAQCGFFRNDPGIIFYIGRSRHRRNQVADKLQT